MFSNVENLVVQALPSWSSAHQLKHIKSSIAAPDWLSPEGRSVLLNFLCCILLSLHSNSCDGSKVLKLHNHLGYFG